MRIGIICYPTFGGSGVLATELGLGLARAGHEVHFITSSRPVRLSQYEPRVFFHEVAPEVYPLFKYTPYETALASKIVDVVTYEKLDILHVHYAIPHAMAAYLAQNILKDQGHYIPFITTLHGTDITLVGTHKAYAPVIKFSIERSDAVTAVSDSLRQQTIEHFDISRPIEVVHNFVNFDRFRPSDKEHFKRAISPNGEKILVHVSNFRPVKRVEDVIRVFANVHRHIPSKLLLIGDGPERARMEALCREIGVCGDIRFLGKQHAVEELLSVSDLFLLCSSKESFGLAALEAMACKVPVVSSDAGGIPEVNIDGMTGYVLPIGDIAGMASRATDLLSDPALHQQMSTAAYEQSLRFSLEHIMPQYEKLYEDTILNATA